MRKFIIDTDTASDDAAALMIAALTPEIELLGVTIVAGNVPLRQAADNALMTLEVCKCGAPVFLGAKQPLFHQRQATVSIHGEDGMGDCGIIHPAGKPEEKRAVEFILEQVSKYPDEVELIALGPVTNIALAILTDREIMSRVKRIWSMGTPGFGAGNATPVSEFNVFIDAEAYALIGIKCFGEYSIRITNPLLFYTHVCGNMGDSLDRSAIEGQMRTELLTALQPAFAKLNRVDYTALPAHTMELADALNDVLSSKWRDLRGIEIVSFGVSSVTANPEDEERLKRMQDAAFIGGGNVMAGTAVSAQADALRSAAANPNGAMSGFMGVGMAQGVGGSMFGGIPMQGQPNVFAAGAAPAAAPAAPAAPAGDTWKCACGATVTGNFCPECGAKKPAPAAGWTCSCGTVNQGKTPYSGDREYQRATAPTKVNDVPVGIAAFLLFDDLGGGSTYYKLRDVGQALGFNVGWSADRGIYLEPGVAYSFDD